MPAFMTNMAFVFPHYVGQAIELHHRAENRWYYAREQQEDEIWVFKCYDSRADVAIGSQHPHIQLLPFFDWLHLSVHFTFVN